LALICCPKAAARRPQSAEIAALGCREYQHWRTSILPEVRLAEAERPYGKVLFGTLPPQLLRGNKRPDRSEHGGGPQPQFLGSARRARQQR